MNPTCIMIHKTVYLSFQPAGIILMVVNLPVVTKNTFSCSKASQLEVYGKYVALCEL